MLPDAERAELALSLIESLAVVRDGGHDIAQGDMTISRVGPQPSRLFGHGTERVHQVCRAHRLTQVE